MPDKAYAMYLRKSRADMELQALGEGETLSKHRSILTKLAEKHNIPMSSITVYQEIVSGDTIADRPQMQRLLTDIYRRKYAAVFVVEIERLARGSTTDQGHVADAFQTTGTKIITPSKIYDPNNPYDQEYFEFGLFMARREFQTIKRRMMAGRAESLKQGNFLGGHCVYGYEIKKSRKKITLEIVPEKAEIVRMIFNWFTQDGLNYRQISNKLYDMRIPNPSGNEKWSFNTIKCLLINIHYTGCVRNGLYRAVSEFDEVQQKVVKRHKYQPLEKQTIIRNAHEAIITEEQFAKAQSIIGSHPRCKDPGVFRNPFAGLVRCPLCGTLYQLKVVNGKYYVNHINTSCIEKHRIPMTDFAAIVCEALTKSIDDFEFIISDDGEKKRRNTAKKEIAVLTDKLAKAKLMKTRLYDAFEQGIYSNDEFIERKNNAASLIAELQQKIDLLQNRSVSPIDYRGKIASIHSVINTINDSSISAKQKNIFMKSILSKIELKIIKGKSKFDLTPYIDIFFK